MIDEPLTIRQVMEQAHETAKAKGWWEDWDRNVPEQLALMHSEISEALEEYRKDGVQGIIKEYYTSVAGFPQKPEGFGVEMADIVIRIADTCQRYGIDLERCLREKMAFNESRPHRHGGKVC